ncbi:MAG: hypothetical protein OEN50_09865, partial [Deltaproteobacteria bacterium]|nr:hypothetical protein [Deltaproteobacteria bacterium]
SDLGLAQAFAVGETERADQIKRLESTLVRQISDLRHHILESRAAEFDELKSEIFTFTDRIARIEAPKAPSDTVKDYIQNELGALRAQVNNRQVHLESQQAGFQTLGDALKAQIRALEEQIREKFDGLRSAQGDMRTFKSEAQSLTQRVAQVESAAWQTKTLSARSAQQCEQTAEVLRQEIAAIKIELGEQRRDSSSADSQLKETQQGLSAQIEEITVRLANDIAAQQGRDARVGRLDAELATLAKRLSDTESLTREINAIAQRDAQSTSEIRQEFEAKLNAVSAVLDEAETRETKLRGIEDKLLGQFEEFRQQVTQTFLGLERRNVELERSVLGLEESLSARVAKQEERLGDSLRAVAITQDELKRYKAGLQSITEYISRAESASAQAEAEISANTKRIDELSGGIHGEIAALKADLNEQQRNFRLPDEQVREIENKFGARIGELERQFAVEREGFGHWEKGLRETFSSELSAIHGRLSERQSQIEHRHARFDRLEENLTAKFGALEHQLTETLQSRESSDHRWGEFQSEIRALSERTGRLESVRGEAQALIVMTRQQVEESIASLRAETYALKEQLDKIPADREEAIKRNVEDSVAARLQAVHHEMELKFSSLDSLRVETRALKEQLDKIPADREEAIKRNLEDSVAAKLQAVHHEMELKFSSLDSRDIERFQQTQQNLTNVKTELEALKTVMEQKPNNQSTLGNYSHVTEDIINDQMSKIDGKIAEQISILEGRDTERARNSQTIIASLQSEISALKSSIDGGAAESAKSATRGLEDSIIIRIQDLQDQLAQQTILRDKRDAERGQEAERIIGGLKADLEAIKADLKRQPNGAAIFDPALRGLEENLSAKIYGLSEQVAQKFSIFDKRDTELQELKDRSQSLIQRVAHLGTAVQALQKLGPSSPSVMAAPPTEVPENAPENNVEAAPVAVHARQYSTENEQLIKLQERMSSEIERVRAELKERSGRWKMRKNVSGI